MSYSQGDTYYATRLEVGTFVTSMSLLIMRQSDGLFLDWADTTFKVTPGTPTRALTEVTPPGETKSFWRDATGYVLPSVDAGYLPLFKDSDGGLQQGDRIEVKTVASSGLTQQQVRDAMKLAPTAGAPTAGSVDDHLDIINTDTTTDIPATIAALNDFDPATDTVVNVTNCAVNADMRGTDGANTTAPDNTSIAAILVDTGTTIPAAIAALNDYDPATDQVIVATNNDKTGYTVAVGGIGATSFGVGAIDASALATDAAAEIATSVINSVVEAQGSYTLKQVMSVTLAVLAGVTTNNGNTLKTPDGIATRVIAATDASQNRTSMNVTP